jgi:hypothetical protein
VPLKYWGQLTSNARMNHDILATAATVLFQDGERRQRVNDRWWMCSGSPLPASAGRKRFIGGYSSMLRRAVIGPQRARVQYNFGLTLLCADTRPLKLICINNPLLHFVFCLLPCIAAPRRVRHSLYCVNSPPPRWSTNKHSRPYNIGYATLHEDTNCRE